MASEDGPISHREQLLRLKAAAADAMSAVASLDMALVMLLSDIIAPPPMPASDLELASIIVFGQNTIERRVDVVRKVLTLRLRGALQAKPHEYPNRVATFIIKAFNKIADDAKKDTWIRNTVAHGNYLVGEGREPSIIPVPFDFESVERFNERRGVVSKRSPIPENGFVASELEAFAASLRRPHRQFMTLRAAMMLILYDRDPETLEKVLVGLGKDLQLQAPLRVRPPRGKRPPKKTG